ncbi:MAG: T6SS immunity protein Tdi1 domain-containing protein, partial [Bacteroidota bacterium]
PTIRDEWFLIELVRRIRISGKQLEGGKLFGYKQLPIIGGTYEPENFALTLIEIHFNLSGQIHRQLKDLPDGTRIKIKIKK